MCDVCLSVCVGVPTHVYILERVSGGAVVTGNDSREACGQV